MVEVMKITATSFQRSCSRTATLSAPDPAAGHSRPTPPLETLGHLQAGLAQSLVGSLLHAPGSWCTQGFVCVLQESVFPQSIGSSVINPADHQSQIPWLYSVPLPDPQIGKSLVWPRTLAAV